MRIELDIDELQRKHQVPEVFKGLAYNGVDYSSKYEISNYGRIRSRSTGQILSAHIRSNINCAETVIYSDEGKRVNIILGRAVACTFMDNFNYKTMAVGKKCRDTHDYFVGNLVTIGEFTHKNGCEEVMNSRLGSRNGNSKLNEEAVKFIRESRDRYSIRELASTLDVSTYTIKSVIRGRTWRHVGLE